MQEQVRKDVTDGLVSNAKPANPYVIVFYILSPGYNCKNGLCCGVGQENIL